MFLILLLKRLRLVALGAVFLLIITTSGAFCFWEEEILKIIGKLIKELFSPCFFAVGALKPPDRQANVDVSKIREFSFFFFF